jgi:uracil-DNA glycosylase
MQPLVDSLADAALAVAAYDRWLPDWPLCGFLPLVGSSYDRILMVVGRAANDWSDSWHPEQIDTLSGAQRFAGAVQNASNQPVGDAGPMGWVAQDWSNESTYNPARSAFWRVTARVFASLHPSSGNDKYWSDYLAWSNLYKLAPGGGGNPSEKLSRLQFSNCRNMLAEELAALRPQHLLVLAGWNWARPFLQPLAEVSQGDAQVEAVCRYAHPDSSATTIVVAPHPQGLAEDPLVADIVRAFQAASGSIRCS